MANLTDLLLSVGKRGTLTTLKPPGKSIGAEALKIEQSLSWPTDSKVAFSIRRVNVGGENDGLEIEGTYTEWTGILNTEDGSIDNLNLEQGNDQDYPPGDGTEVFIHVSITIWEHLMQALRNVMTMDGKLKRSAVESAIGTNIDTRWDETFGDYVVPGTGIVSVVAGLTIAISDIIYYIAGVRYTKLSIPNKILTASKDTYCFVNNSTGAITYTEVANNAAPPATPAGNVCFQVIVTGASAVVSMIPMNRRNDIYGMLRFATVGSSGGWSSGVNTDELIPFDTLSSDTVGVTKPANGQLRVSKTAIYTITLQMNVVATGSSGNSLHRIEVSTDDGATWRQLTTYSPAQLVVVGRGQVISTRRKLTAGTRVRAYNNSTTNVRYADSNGTDMNTCSLTVAA